MGKKGTRIFDEAPGCELCQKPAACNQADVVSREILVEAGGRGIKIENMSKRDEITLI
jgi:hypothetical protein